MVAGDGSRLDRINPMEITIGPSIAPRVTPAAEDLALLPADSALQLPPAFLDDYNGTKLTKQQERDTTITANFIERGLAGVSFLSDQDILAGAQDQDQVGPPEGLRLNSEAETELALAEVTNRKIPPIPTGNNPKVDKQINEARSSFDISG